MAVLMFAWIEKGRAIVKDTVSGYDLEQCISYALQNNPDIRLNYLHMEDRQRDLMHSKGERLPELQSSFFQGFQFGRSIDPTTNAFAFTNYSSNSLGLYFSLMLYNGGAIKNGIKESELRVESASIGLNIAKERIQLNVLMGYLDVLLKEELSESAKSILKITTDQMKQTRVLIDAGLEAESEMYKLKAQRASQELDVIRAESDLEMALLKLKQEMFFPDERHLTIISPKLIEEQIGTLDVESFDYIMDLAYKTSLEVKQSEVDIESSIYGQKKMKGLFLPKVSLNAENVTNYSSAQNTIRQVATGNKITMDPSPIGFLESNPEQVVYSLPYETDEYEIKDGYSLGKQWNDNMYQNVNLRVNIPIFNGFKNKAQSQKSKIATDKLEVERQKVEITLRNVLKQAYLDAKAAHKAHQSAKQELSSSQYNMDMAQKLFNNGKGSFVDFQVAQQKVFIANSNLIQSKYNYIFKRKILDFYMTHEIIL